jgi:hypothetical protein
MAAQQIAEINDSREDSSLMLSVAEDKSNGIPLHKSLRHKDIETRSQSAERQCKEIGSA